MSLIEGIGDEVTLVFIFLLLAVVILFAWLSTHTDDMSLFREMGVIVVELSQRRTLYRNNRTEGTEPPSNEAAPSGSDQDTANENSLPSDAEAFESTNDQTSVSTLSSHSSSSTDLPPNEVVQPSQSVATNSSPPLQQDRDSGSMDTMEDGEGGVTSGNDSLHEEVVIGETQCLANSVSSPPLNGAEIRQRRVQYFQEGRQDSVRAQASTRGDNPLIRNAQDDRAQISKSDDQREAGASSNIEKSLQGNRLYEETAESQPQSVLSTDTPASPPSRENSQEPATESDNLSDSQIRVRLQYMNETQRYVLAKPDDTIGDFRRTHFQSEIADNKWVRFIFNGQDLRDDARTLQACNIVNNSTMHCLVTTQTRPQPQHDSAAEDEDDSMLGTLMYPLFAFLLAIVWYFRFTYRQYFSAMSTVCLIGISFILVLSYISSFRMSDSQQMQPPQQTTQPAAETPNARERDSN